ncbi:MAG: L-seryl-tRNA(Sec) selenium transferase, partial [Anaerolineales bacterium]|nr:L-seryl-tRNA(Sec) selenium transferase [Anaerolineales bacterium]
MSHLSKLPAVERLLQTHTAAELIAVYGRPLTLRAIRQTLEAQRAELLMTTEATVPSAEQILAQTAQLLERWTTPTLLPVINATGVILHTNLGRAPLSRAALTAMEAASRGYATLEFDLKSGKRGSRHIHAEEALQLLTGAEAALVVNNNAAALLLILSALARRKRVIVARSQLIEIGGGFRIPEVLQQSGAKLVEIG